MSGERTAFGIFFNELTLPTLKRSIIRVRVGGGWMMRVLNKGKTGVWLMMAVLPIFLLPMYKNQR